MRAYRTMHTHKYQATHTTIQHCHVHHNLVFTDDIAQISSEADGVAIAFLSMFEARPFYDFNPKHAAYSTV